MTKQFTITADHRGHGRYKYNISKIFIGEYVEGVDVSRLTPRALEVWNEKGPSEKLLASASFEI